MYINSIHADTIEFPVECGLKLKFETVIRSVDTVLEYSWVYKVKGLPPLT